MHFEDSPAEAAFRREARSWLARHAEPRRGRGRPAVIADADPTVEARHVEEAKAWQRTCFEGGWAGITWPSEHGGRGGTAGEQIIFDQEQAYARSQVLRYLGWRVRTAVSRHRSPGSESSVLKLALCRHLAASADAGMALAGPAATIFDHAAPAPGAPAAALLGQWASRLGGGTEQIQANIVGERVLGLPREPRGDARRET